MQWDIFCTVVDNYGDAGVCWRLARHLVHHAQRVRLWIDDLDLLHRLSPEGFGRVQVYPWPEAPSDYTAPADVVIEAFGCALPPLVLEALGNTLHSCTPPPVWLNLEYLSAEWDSERNHRLPSPVMSGPAKGLTKYFFYPGFTARTGGLLGKSAQEAPVRLDDRTAWRARFDPDAIDASAGETWVSLFCYEPAALAQLLDALGRQPQPVRIWVTAGRSSAALEQLQAVSTTDAMRTWPRISKLPFVSQDDYDRLLRMCDLNFVRGEDSLVRAIWATHPFVWQPYPQEDGLHLKKLQAFLDLADVSPLVRQTHRWWNSDQRDTAAPPIDKLLQDGFAADLCARLSQQAELALQLIGFASEKYG